MTVEEGQDRSASLPEQYICQRASCRSHNESNCTHFESIVKHALALAVDDSISSHYCQFFDTLTGAPGGRLDNHEHRLFKLHD